MITALFKQKLKRLELIKLAINKDKPNFRISIYRNHSFEMVANVLNAFLSVSNINAEFIYSNYDDSLNFNYKDADLHIIWLDIDRYKTDNLVKFLEERILLLRSYSTKPIIFAYIGKLKINLSSCFTDFICIPISDELSFLGEKLYDYKKEQYSGTHLSGIACLELARLLGLRYIPSILYPGIKAIVVDLDNTLYSGILGEDGIENITPNNMLQQQLKDLKNKGMLLAISSKNEIEDVKKMFEYRKDFILCWSDFAAFEINWNPKSDCLLKIATRLNIATDSMLFIDDNPAEIENVSSTGVNALIADENICNVLKYYPRLTKLNILNEDSIRSNDIQANIKRAEMAKKLSPYEYFKKLGIKLTYSVNDKTQIQRIAELLGKTNQFILSYARYNETEVEKFMSEKGKCIVTIKMSDKLSDSGIIAIAAFHRVNNMLECDELVVSCRALGRNLENIMLPYLFVVAQKKLKTLPSIRIVYKKGKRNFPSIDWLCKLTNNVLKDSGLIEYKIPKNILFEGIKVYIK